MENRMDYMEMVRIQEAGFVDVDCTAKCGHAARVAPDGDHVCNECGKGRLVSPLVLDEEISTEAFALHLRKII